jgi:hypothetical protein
VDSDGNNLVELPEKIINAPGTYNFVKIRTLDLSSDFETQPTVEQLRSKTERYINANEIGVPRVSLTVSFAQLEQHEEYKQLKLLERVGLFDTVNVEFPALGVSATAKAVKMVYDVLADRVKSVTLGSVRANIADTIVEQQKEIEGKPSKSMVEKISDNLAAAITGANGGSVRLLDTNGDGKPDTLYIADNPNPAQAVKVWRFNYEGWAASDNGYNGPFVMGATFDDGILSNLINVANLFAQNITMTGTFVNTTDAFLEPNQEVLNTINNHLLGISMIPSNRIPLYDFNNSGTITISDLTLCHEAVIGKSSLAGWSGAKRTPVTVTINLSNPARAIVLSGTDMWGGARETVIGVDPSAASFVTKDLLGTIVSMDINGGMTRRIGTETEYINPPMDLGIEYRTAERWNGKPVYTMLVDYGHMPDSTEGENYTLAPGLNVIDIRGFAAGEKYIIPVPGYFAIHNMGYTKASGNLWIETTRDLSNYHGYITVKYTKDSAIPDDTSRLVIADDGNGNVTIQTQGNALITDDGAGNVIIVNSGSTSITDDGAGNVTIL